MRTISTIWLPASFAAACDGDLLVLQVAVGEAKVDLGGAVAAVFPAERTAHGDVIFRKLLHAGRDRSRALLATHDIDVRFSGVIPAAAQHGVDVMANVKRKSNSLVVDGDAGPGDCAGALGKVRA